MRFGPNTIFGFFIFLAVVLFSLALQSTLINGVLSAYLYPDIVLVIVVYIGLRRELMEGIIWTLLISYVYAMHSAFTTISCSLLMLLIFFVSRYIVRNFYLLKKREYFLGIAAPIFAQKLALSVWLYWHNVLAMLVGIVQSVTTTIITTIVGLFVLRLLTALDVWSGKLDDSSLVGKKD